jgi:hypothetical protein
MSSRLHNKYHRHNHHTITINDPRYPDASHDPIASYASPFLGDFILQGTLSATQINEDQPAIVANGNAEINGGLTVENGIATNGDITTTGSLITEGVLSATSISFQGAAIISTFATPLTANGDFLLLTVNGEERALRLWSII